MANESPYAGLYYCEKCHKTKPEKEFYSSRNLIKYPNNGKLNQCKQCITMHVDNWDPNTYLWILEECDVPYVPSEWIKLMQTYAKDNSKLSGATILGRYLGKMRLNQYKEYRWADSEFVQALAEQKIKDVMKQTGQYSASEIAMAVEASREYEMPEKPPELIPAPAQPTFYFQEEEESLENNLTPEDITYLKIKWGRTYKPDEWIQLEKLYNDMMESYDIQTAGHIDTLKFICKTSLKANQLLDLGDVDGAQKMLKMYDSMMKSGKFTEAQNKAEKGEAIDSISELVAICEKEGFIPRYYTEGPQDKVDRVLQDLQQYTRTLVVEEMGLGTMIEKAAKQIEEDRKLKESNDGAEDDEEAMEDELFSPAETPQITADDMFELLDQEDEFAIEDWNYISGEGR